jgi:hypothetical protein
VSEASETPAVVKELGDTLRVHLGLAEGEGLRLLEAGPRTVILERVCEEEELPCSGPPALRAEIAVFALFDILGAIHAAGKSGFIHFTYHDHWKSVYLHKGEVVFARSNQRVDRLGECLLRAGVISLEQLREAERRFSPPTRFGKVLVERGFLTPRELWTGVKYQVEEIVRSLFSYPAGELLFWEGEIQPDNVVRLSLDTSRLISEGIQRRDELRKFLSVLEDPRVQLATIEGASGQLTGNERVLTETIGTGRPFPEVCKTLGFDRESAARSIQLLRLVGAVKLVRVQAEDGFLDESDLERHDDEQLRSLVTDLTKLICELAMPLARAEGRPDGIRDRLGRILDEAAGRFPALLTGVTLSPDPGLDPEPLVERALKLPGNREEQVALALGELVSYLEFEIKNHPGIEGPDAILAGLSELRAALGI